MALSDVYSQRGTITLAATTSTAVFSLYGTAAKRLWLVGVRVKILQTGAVAGNDVTFTLARPSATNTGTTLTSGIANDFSAPASLGQTCVTWSTAPIVGTILGEWALPQTTGSMWEEFPPGGDEWGVPAIANANANAGVHLFAQATVATSTPISYDFIWSE
jgi:hypothetical protein